MIRGFRLCRTTIAAVLAVALVCLLAPARAQAFQAGTPPAQGNQPPSEAELRARIKAELLQEIRKEQEINDLKKEVEALRESIKTQQQAQAAAPRDASVQPATAATQPVVIQPVVTGPVVGQRYQVPAEYASTPAGYTITYAGYNYIANGDGTMSYYAGSVTTAPLTAPPTAPSTLMYPSSANWYWNPVLKKWVYGGYWSGSGTYWPTPGAGWPGSYWPGGYPGAMGGPFPPPIVGPLKAPGGLKLFSQKKL